MLIRSTIARLSRIERDSHGSRATYVGNNRVLVKCIVADATIAYYVEADDRLLAPWFIVTGKYETEITNYFVGHLRSDSHCLDVGSNFGYFTCLMSRFCPDGLVIALEADQVTYELVRDNIAINSFRHARAIHTAAADHDGQVELFRRNTRSGNTSIAPAHRVFTDELGELPIERFLVKATRIDDLRDELKGRVDFVKIDVEGAEPLVMKGAAETIAANPQIAIVMEWSPGQLQAAGFDVGDFIRDLAATGLKPFDLTGRTPSPLTFGGLVDIPYRNGILLKRA